MKIPDSLVEKFLNKTVEMTDERMTSLREEAASEHIPLQDLVIRDNIISERKLTQMYADEIEVPFTNLKPDEIDTSIMALLPEKIATQYRAILFGTDPDGTKLLAMDDPDDVQAINSLQKQLGGRPKIYMAPSRSIQAALDIYRKGNTSELSKELYVSEEQQDEEEEVSRETLSEDSPVAKTVNLIIEYAIKAGASDIHIEPEEDYVMVRYRIDGILHEVNKLPKKVHNALVSRIKILSNLKIDERRVPQDGRIKIELGKQMFALRVSTLPVSDGEKVVMRILDESSNAIGLSALGYWGDALKAVEIAIAQPYGMILVTGPTGSGKSTSLFSILNKLNRPEVNISTIEDPIEYKIHGVNQTQVNPKVGMTFANGLRALLRQDPNIIMVGEIRDEETADLGVQAALTGHLVFATLHTNDAATCLPRLLDMGIEPFLIATTIRLVVGQRLVRKLCPHCREKYEPDEDTVKHLNRILGIDGPADIQHIHELEQQALDAGVGVSNEEDDKALLTPSSTEERFARLWRAHEGGCEHCNASGYKGRLGIYEVLATTPEIQTLIEKRASSNDLKKQALLQGMITMQWDGFIKVLRGLTSIEELLRVTSER